MEWDVALLNCEHFLGAHGLFLGENCQERLFYVVIDQPLLRPLDSLGAESIQKLPLLNVRVLGYSERPALPLGQ